MFLKFTRIDGHEFVLNKSAILKVVAGSEGHSFITLELAGTVEDIQVRGSFEALSEALEAERPDLPTVKVVETVLTPPPQESPA